MPKNSQPSPESVARTSSAKIKSYANRITEVLDQVTGQAPQRGDGSPVRAGQLFDEIIARAKTGKEAMEELIAEEKSDKS